MKIEHFYLGYFVFLAVICGTFFLISSKIQEEKKDKIKSVFKVVLGMGVFTFLIAGSSITDFSKNIVTQAPFLVLGAFIADQILIERASLSKFLNAEFKNEQLGLSKEYIHEVENKIAYKTELIYRACGFVTLMNGPPSSHIEAYTSLSLCIEDYLNNYELVVRFYGEIPDNNNDRIRQIKEVMREERLGYDRIEEQELYETLYFYSQNDTIPLTKSRVLVPINGENFKILVALESKTTISTMDASVVRDIGRILF